MAPAEITSIVVDEESHTMDLAVQKEQLSQAIGRNGQNVRLASQLTGWTLNVMTVEDFDQKSNEESTKLLQLFTDALDIDVEIANLLVQHGFSSLEEIAYVPKEELLAIEAFDEEIVEELRHRANDVLLTEALTSSEQAMGEENTATALTELEGITPELEEQLSGAGIMTVEELAEQSVDELMQVVAGITAEKAAALIMKAREPWFN